MFQSFLIRLGMWAATVGVVFWVGWSLPASLERDRESDLSPMKAASAEGPVVQTTEPAARKPASPSNSPPRAVGESTPAVRTGKLDLNRATLEDIESLPGIGPVLAARIVEYRKAKGAFRSIGDLRSVKGIGKKKFERVRPLLIVTPITKPAVREKQHT